MPARTRFLAHDHPLATLQAQAALASGWPTLHADVDPDGADELADRTERALGPLPHGELLDRGDRTELRVDLPGLEPSTWALAAAALHHHDVPAVLAPGMPPGAREALDLGHVQRLPHGDGALLTTSRIDPHSALPARLDLALRAPDDELEPLERELALASADARVTLATDRGHDTVDAVLHRSSGRFGVRLSAAPGQEPDLHRWLAALAEVVRAHALDPQLRLAPDAHVEQHLAASITLWLIGPAVPDMPAGETVHPGLHLAAHLPGSTHEVQLLPRDLEAHDAAVHHALVLAERHALVGGRPRWVRTPGGYAFAPTWHTHDATASSLAALGDQLLAHEAVLAVRVVPRCPGDADGAQTRDPRWRRSPAGRALLSWHDGPTDDGWAPHLVDRDPDDHDHAALDALRGAVPGEARPVALAGSARPALALRGLPAACRHPDGLGAVLTALDARMPIPRWPLALAAWRRRGDALILIRSERGRSTE